MRKIIVPDAVTFAPIEGCGAPDPGMQKLSFVGFVNLVLGSASTSIADHAAVALTQAIVNRLPLAKVGEPWVVPDDVHEHLRKLVVGFPFAPIVKLTALPLIAAITGAQDAPNPPATEVKQ